MCASFKCPTQDAATERGQKGGGMMPGEEREMHCLDTSDAALQEVKVNWAMRVGQQDTGDLRIKQSAVFCAQPQENERVRGVTLR